MFINLSVIVNTNLVYNFGRVVLQQAVRQAQCWLSIIMGSGLAAMPIITLSLIKRILPSKVGQRPEGFIAINPFAGVNCNNLILFLSGVKAKYSMKWKVFPPQAKVENNSGV